MAFSYKKNLFELFHFEFFKFNPHMQIIGFSNLNFSLWIKIRYCYFIECFIPWYHLFWNKKENQGQIFSEDPENVYSHKYFYGKKFFSCAILQILRIKNCP